MSYVFSWPHPSKDHFPSQVHLFILTSRTHIRFMLTCIHAYMYACMYVYMCIYTSLNLGSAYERKHGICLPCLSTSGLVHVTTSKFYPFSWRCCDCIFLIPKYRPDVHIYYIFFIHSSVDGYRWLHFLAVVISAAVTSICKCLSSEPYQSFGYCLRLAKLW